MHIAALAGIFIVSYVVQLLLCYKVKNKHIKLIPAYLGFMGIIYSFLLYVEFFGHYNSGSWMQLEAVIYLICLTIMFTALLLAYCTQHFVNLMTKRRKKQ